MADLMSTLGVESTYAPSEQHDIAETVKEADIEDKPRPQSGDMAKQQDMPLVRSATVKLTNFFDLPFELRESVYGYFLRSQTSHNIRPRTAMWSGTQTSLLKTSSQLRSEDLPVFYRVNIFEVRMGLP